MLGRHSSTAGSLREERLRSDATPIRQTQRLPPRVWGYGVLFGALLPLAAALQADAQSAEDIRHVQSVEPLSGPVGTTVRVYTENLPYQASTHVGFGSSQVGFEVLAKADQDARGAVSAALDIPAWATWDRPLVLLVFNGLFNPIGRSDPFHVTNAEGLIQRSGSITHVEGDCVDFRDEDDFLYSLEGLLPEFDEGDEVIVEGVPTRSAQCGSGLAIRVEHVGPVRRVAMKTGH